MLPGDQTKIPTSAVTAAVLAGGKSSRFGADKALARIPGTHRSLLELAIASARHVAETIVVIGSIRPGFDAPDTRFVPDRFPGQGPGGGLVTALAWSQTPFLVVLSCDQPLIRRSDLAALLDACFEHSASAFRSRSGEINPLPCALETVHCRDVVDQLFDAGTRSMHALLAACNPVLIDPGEGCEGDGRLADIDTPDDLLDIGRQIRETGLD